MHNKSIQATWCSAPLHTKRLMLAVSAPRKAWCILQGASPCRVRPNQSPVSRVASVTELDEKYRRTKQAKRTQRIMQAAGETALPEVLVSLRNELVPIAEGRNVCRRQYKNIRNGKDMKDRRSYQAVACIKRCTKELGRPLRFHASIRTKNLPLATVNTHSDGSMVGN